MINLLPVVSTLRPLVLFLQIFIKRKAYIMYNLDYLTCNPNYKYMLYFLFFYYFIKLKNTLIISILLLIIHAINKIYKLCPFMRPSINT